MSDDPEQFIIQLLHSEHGIALSKLVPSARLLHDLGVDGDDAVEFFQRIQDHYGTDFSSLGPQWRTFFGDEGLSPGGLFLSLGVMALSITVSIVLGVNFHLSEQAGGIIGVASFVLVWWPLHRIWKHNRHPVSIAGLADIIRQGIWPSDPSLVS